MKLQRIVLAASLALVLASCSEDEEGEGTLTGKWRLQSEREVVNGQSETFAWEHQCSSKKDFVEFHPDGKFDWTEYNEACEVAPEGTIIGAGWSQTGNVITFTGDPELTTATIETLSSSTLVVKEQMNENTVVYLTLKRQ